MNLPETKRNLLAICKSALVDFPEPAGRLCVMSVERLDELIGAAWRAGNDEPSARIFDDSEQLLFS